MTDRFVCIHGHFYQPPRENPWLEEIEVQDSAHPYRDWNEKITEECYSTNSAARILTAERRIRSIIDNYSRISFNFGPTLLSWLEKHAPETYAAVLDADRESIGRFGGHGSAVAQVYNHVIMPLANDRDKRTQIEWGIADFTKRFGRFPEGMWLAETAVDTPTLELLAEYGIRFTILSPSQAAFTRRAGEEEWKDVSGGLIDTRRAYLSPLPSGRSIALFFYDGSIAHEVAFGNLLSNGDDFANRLLSVFSEEPTSPELSHIATDGETYGHHHRFGEMALARCLSRIEEEGRARLTVYGEFLDEVPPESEAKIFENSSWSCIHGVERWRSDCGCGSGRPDWNQLWRAPLRDAFDWLRDEAAPFYERHMEAFTDDPWGVRNRYIRIILNRNPASLESFFETLRLGEDRVHAAAPQVSGGAQAPAYAHRKGPDPERGARRRLRLRRERLLQLLEMQRHLLLMYTSCGWFFEEVSGIETVQNMEYAARALQLGSELGMTGVESGFIDRLDTVPCNLPRMKTARRVWERYVKPSVVDRPRVAAHFGVSALFHGKPATSRIYVWETETEDFERMETGHYRMVIGRVRFRSVITLEEETLTFAFLHQGDHNLNGGVRKSLDPEAYRRMKDEIRGAFRRLSVMDLLNLIRFHFGTERYSLASLFREEARTIYGLIMEPARRELEHSLRSIYENLYPILRSMVDSNTPIPKEIRMPADLIVNTELERMLALPGPIDTERLRALRDEALALQVSLDSAGLSYTATRWIISRMEELRSRPFDAGFIEAITETLGLLLDLGITPNLWKPQNILFVLWKDYYAEAKDRGTMDDADDAGLGDRFSRLEKLLNSDITV